MMHIYYSYIIYSSFIMTPDVSIPLSMPISLSSFCPCFFKSQGWYHTNKKLCKTCWKKCVRSIMMCRYSPCLVHWYWKIVQTGCPPPGTPTCSVGAESVPEKELTASRELTASKKSGPEIGEVRVGHWICESVCHSFFDSPKNYMPLLKV